MSTTSAPSFKWSLPPESPLFPVMSAGTPDDYAVEAEALDWFLNHCGDRPVVDATTPIRRAQRNLERWSKKMASQGPSGSSSTLTPDTMDIVHRCDLFLGRTVAQWVRILEGHRQRNATSVTIEPSFVSDNLGYQDSGRVDGPWVPGGIGTLYVATRCIHFGGGSIVIGGRKSPGADVYWRPAADVVVLIERKDRAFYKAFDPNMSPHDATQWMRTKIAEATTGLQDRARNPTPAKTVLRIASVGGIFPSKTADFLHEQAKSIAEKVALNARLQKRRLPDAMMTYVMGMGDASTAPSSLPHVVQFGDQAKPGFDAFKATWTKQG